MSGGYSSAGAGYAEARALVKDIRINKLADAL
jgi:hypothetical protein